MARIWKRRNYVVNRKLQLTLMFISFGYVILFCAVMAAYLFIPLMRDMDISERDSLAAFVASIRLVYLDETFWPALLLSFLAIACHSIFISSKIAGPLSRFSRIFREIKEGIVPGPMQLRPRDYL
jgi:hypothetical protein